MRDPQRQSPIWLFAVACALTVATLHIAFVAIRLHVFNEFTWTSRDIVWMAPIAYLGLFLLAILPALLFARLGRRRWGEVLLAALGVWLLLLLWQTLAPVAAIVLALGSGMLLAQLWNRAYNKSPSALRRGVLGLAVLATVIAAAGATAPGIGRMVARAAPPPGEAPNVLLLILDTVRAQSMSVYGYARRTTPHLENLARQGVVFDNAIATSSWSLPSHASLLTGVWPHEQGGGYRQPVRRDLPTVAEAFRARGYATGGFTANMGFAGHESGFARGFDRFEDYQRNLAQLLLTPTVSQTQAVQLAIDNARGGYLRGMLSAFRPRNLRLIGVRRAARAAADHRTQRFLAWSASVQPRPFFAFINLFDAHSPYEPPSPFRTAFGDGRRELDRYDGAIAYLDSVVHDVLSELQRRGDLDRTLVVITSDHGELFGEHGFDGHGTTLYLPSIRVPLVMRLPDRVPAGQRVARPISLRDLPATLIDLVGLEPATPFPGMSLRAAWTGGGHATLSPVFSEATRGINVPPSSQTYLGPIHSLLDSTTHYIRLANAREELYDWRNDPGEGQNLAASSAHGAILAQHRRTLELLMLSAQPER